MNKHILHILVGLVLVFTGCEKVLEVEDQRIQELNYFESETEVAYVTNEAFRRLASSDAMGGGVWLASELMSDNINGQLLQGDFGAYYNRNTGIFISFTRNIWREMYAATAEANRVLNVIDDVPMDENKKPIYKGALHFVRAVTHFELVRLFAQPYNFTPDNRHLGIPIRNFWDITNLTEPLNRSSVNDVYTFVIDELNTAIDLLPDVNPIQQSYPNALSAKAYLARVYFQMNAFDMAYDLANDVINSGQYQLNDDFLDRFNDDINNSEFIFYQSSMGAYNAGAGFKGHYFNNDNVPTITLSENFYEEASSENGDLRRSDGWFGTRGDFYVLNKVGGNNENIHQPVLHLTELMLIRAESAMELGMVAAGKADLDAIRNRAGLGSALDELSVTQLIEEVQKQRRLEMVGEGNRLHDLKRIAVNGNNSLEIRGSIWNCPGMVVQLPDEELGANAQMQPNPQGGC